MSNTEGTKVENSSASAEKTEIGRMWSGVASSISLGFAAGFATGGIVGLMVASLVTLGVFCALNAIASDRPSTR